MKLKRLLEEGLASYFDRQIRITRIVQEPHSERSTWPIHALSVTLSSGEELPVVFKELRVEGAATAAAHFELPKGNRREVLVYRRLLAGGRFGAPSLYASVYDETLGRYWLFLEDVGERTLNYGDTDAWLAAVRWLGEMHGTFTGREQELRALDCLDEHDANYYRSIAAAARHNIELASTRTALARFGHLMSDYEGIVADLLVQPRTLVHGDILVNNIIVQRGARIRPIDWESAAIGIGAFDLALLLDGWDNSKQELVSVYLAERARHCRRCEDMEEFAVTFARCEFLEALWHLGWSLDDCRSEAFVDESLSAMEMSRHQLEKGRLCV